MTVPIVYRGAGRANVNYDFFDIATGVAYKTFYLAYGYSGTDTETGILTTEQVYSSTAAHSSGNGLGAFDIDFDVTFLKPLTIGGDVVFNIPYGTYNNAGSASFDQTVKVYKVVGVTETQLGSTTSISETQSGGWTARAWNGKVTIPRTLIQAGDKIRVSLTGNDVGATHMLTVLHDPANRSYDLSGGVMALSSRSYVNIPIKADV